MVRQSSSGIAVMALVTEAFMRTVTEKRTWAARQAPTVSAA
jgi:hypothetical protein